MEIMESDDDIEKHDFEHDFALDLAKSPISDALSLDPCMLDGQIEDNIIAE